MPHAALADARTGRFKVFFRGVQSNFSLYSNLHWSLNGSLIALFDRTTNAGRLWDTRLGRLIGEFEVPSLGRRPSGFTFDSSGARFLVHSDTDDGEVHAFNAQTGDHLVGLVGHSAIVNSATYNPDGSRILTASDDGTARLWDARSGKHLASLAGHSAGVYSASYSPDGARILTASDDGTARLWDARSGRPLRRLAGVENVLSFSTSPAGIVTGDSDGQIKIWDGRSGKLMKTLTGGPMEVTKVALSPDGTKIATGADKVIVWDLRSGKRLFDVESQASDITFSPDGARLVVYEGGEMSFWSVETGSNIETTLPGAAREKIVAHLTPRTALIVGCLGRDDAVVLAEVRADGRVTFTAHGLSASSPELLCMQDAIPPLVVDATAGVARIPLSLR